MTDSRQQDQLKSSTPVRTERVFNEQYLWYFKTREGENVGPFRYRSEAESNLDHFMQQLNEKLKQFG